MVLAAVAAVVVVHLTVSAAVGLELMSLVTAILVSGLLF
jgi:hypothetical protein